MATPKYRVVLYRQETPDFWAVKVEEEFDSETNLAFIIDDVQRVRERNQPAICKKVTENLAGRQEREGSR